MSGTKYLPARFFVKKIIFIHFLKSYNIYNRISKTPFRDRLFLLRIRTVLWLFGLYFFLLSPQMANDAHILFCNFAIYIIYMIKRYTHPSL